MEATVSDNTNMKHVTWYDDLLTVDPKTQNGFQIKEDNEAN